MKHLFLAPLPASLGEALHGVRLATELVAAGDEVEFLASEALAPVLAGAKVRYGRIDQVLPRLGEAVLDRLMSQRWDSLAFIDLAAVYKAFDAYGIDLAPLTRAGVPVVALDCWNLEESGLSWDYGPEIYRIDSTRLAPLGLMQRRMIPVPFVRPEVPAGYNALPDLGPLSVSQRTEVRRELGLSGEPLVLWPSAGWQHREAHQSPQRQRLCDAIPELVAGHLAGLPAPTRVLHVGPMPYAAAAAALGTRYRHIAQVAPARFAQLLGAADLLLSCNAAATTIGSALAVELPILLGVNSCGGESLTEVSAAAAAPLVNRVRDWVQKNLPLPRLRAYPLSLYSFLTPVLHANPCYGALTAVELLDAEVFTAAARSLLYDPEQRASAQETQRQLVQKIRQLPSGRSRYQALLRQHSKEK
jgi:hypothetical protein